MKLHKIYILLLVVFYLAAGSAHATPQQGSLGTTSQGSLLISITKSTQAQISDLSDMTLANWSIGGGDVLLTSDVCIYSTTGSYTVKATGDGLLNVFTITTGGLNLIAYSVKWNAGGAGNLADTGTTLITNITSGTFNNASTTSATCNGGGASNDTARVIVSIPEILMNAAASSPTAYTGTLTLLITPV